MSHGPDGKGRLSGYMEDLLKRYRKGFLQHDRKEGGIRQPYPSIETLVECNRKLLAERDKRDGEDLEA